jgi:hypothetical protein
MARRHPEVPKSFIKEEGEWSLTINFREQSVIALRCLGYPLLGTRASLKVLIGGFNVLE